MFGIDDVLIGAAITGAFNYFGQDEANKSNQQIASTNSAFNAAEADKARIFNAGQADLTRGFNAEQAALSRDFNALEAERQRGWATNMSNTSYRRAMHDMQLAGLNPMLAYSQGGAATPGGASASSSPASGPAASGPAASAVNAHPMLNKSAASTQGFTAALQSAQAAAQVKNIEAQTEQTRASTDLTRAQIPKTHQETETSRALQKQLEKQTDLNDEQIEKVKHEVSLLIREYRLKGIQIIKLEEEVMNVAKEGKLIDARTDNVNVDTLLSRLGINAAERESEYAEKAGILSPLLKDLGSGINSAGRLRYLRGR